MRTMIVAAVMAMLTGGCSAADVRAQQPDVGAITPEYVAGLSIDDGEEAWVRIGREIDVRLEKACANSEEEGCRRRTALTAYGDDPILHKNCPRVRYDDCVLLGSEIIVILRSAQADPESEIDWADLGKSYSRAEDLMDAHVERLCAPDKARDSTLCTTMRRIEAFGGSAEAAKRCSEQDVDDRFLCAANVRAAYLYGLALARLPQ
jgi:hypothetical protein